MNIISNSINDELISKGADIVRFVDISMLPNKQTLGFSKAIWFCIALSKQFILDMYNDIPTENDEFVEKESQVENLADWLSDYLIQHGYSAHSQSEKNNVASGYIEQAYYSKELQQGICGH